MTLCSLFFCFCLACLELLDNSTKHVPDKSGAAKILSGPACGGSICLVYIYVYYVKAVKIALSLPPPPET